MNKKDMNIESYEGQDAFYSGTDEEYEEFLRQATAGLDMDGGEQEPEPVDNTQRINLNNTIDLRNVLDKFKKTAGGIGQGAKALKDNVVSKMDKLKTKKSDNEYENSFGERENEDDIKTALKDKVTAQTEVLTEKLAASMKKSADKVDELKGEMKAMADMPDKIDGVGVRLDGINDIVIAISEDIKLINEQLEELGNVIADDNTDNIIAGIENEIQSLNASVTDVRQSVSSISKLNDSVFELKNNQLNTRNAVSNLETAFARLKRKCILGVTILSILSAMIIVLEIVNLLS